MEQVELHYMIYVGRDAKHDELVEIGGGKGGRIPREVQLLLRDVERRRRDIVRGMLLSDPITFQVVSTLEFRL